MLPVPKTNTSNGITPLDFELVHVVVGAENFQPVLVFAFFVFFYVERYLVITAITNVGGHRFTGSKVNVLFLVPVRDLDHVTFLRPDRGRDETTHIHGVPIGYAAPFRRMVALWVILRLTLGGARRMMRAIAFRSAQLIQLVSKSRAAQCRPRAVKAMCPVHAAQSRNRHSLCSFAAKSYLPPSLICRQVLQVLHRSREQRSANTLSTNVLPRFSDGRPYVASRRTQPRGRVRFARLEFCMMSAGDGPQRCSSRR